MKQLNSLLQGLPSSLHWCCLGLGYSNQSFYHLCNPSVQAETSDVERFKFLCRSLTRPLSLGRIFPFPQGGLAIRTSRPRAKTNATLNAGHRFLSAYWSYCWFTNQSDVLARHAKTIPSLQPSIKSFAPCATTSAWVTCCANSSTTWHFATSSSSCLADAEILRVSNAYLSCCNSLPKFKSRLDRHAMRT